MGSVKPLPVNNWNTCTFRHEHDPVTLEPRGRACGRTAVAIICWHDGRRSPMCERHGVKALTPEARKLVAYVEETGGTVKLSAARKGSVMAKAKSKLKTLYIVEVRWVKGNPLSNPLRINPGHWEVRSGEGTRPFSTKLTAVRIGRQVAKAHQPSSLVIYTQGHRHQSERTYPRSRDPRRSKG